MHALVRVAILCSSGVLGGCIVSTKDLSETYPQVFPIDSGECMLDYGTHEVYIINRDSLGYTLASKARPMEKPSRFKILKMPESSDVYVSMIQVGDAKREYDFISAPDKNGGITVYDFAPRHQWLLSAELKSIVDADRSDTYSVKLKNDTQLAQLLRTIIRLKTQDDPEITKLVCKPIDKAFRKPQD